MCGCGGLSLDELFDELNNDTREAPAMNREYMRDAIQSRKDDGWTREQVREDALRDRQDMVAAGAYTGDADANEERDIALLDSVLDEVYAKAA